MNQPPFTLIVCPVMYPLPASITAASATSSTAPNRPPGIHFAHHSGHFGAPRYICPHRRRPPARLPDLLRRALRVLLPFAIVHCHIATRARQRQRNAPPDPAARAGDQCDLVREVFHHYQNKIFRI